MSQATFTIRRADGNDLDRITALLATCELPTADVTLALLHAFLVAVDHFMDYGEQVALATLAPDGETILIRAAPHSMEHTLATAGSIAGANAG